MCFIYGEEEAGRLSVFDRIFNMSQEASDGEPCPSDNASGYSADTYSTDNACGSDYSKDVCGPYADPISHSLQVDNLRSMSMCIRCGVTQVQCMLLPCLHICYCEDCANTARRCPLCRQTIIGTLRIFVEFSLRTNIFPQWLDNKVDKMYLICVLVINGKQTQT